MLDKANVYLKVIEVGRNLNRERRIICLPINSEIENLKVNDIPSYVGMEYAEARVCHDPEGRSTVSDATLSCWLAGEITVEEYAIFSLLEAIENHASMKRTSEWIRASIDPVKLKKILGELQQKEETAMQALSKVMDQKTLEDACEKVRSFSSPVPIYNLINELGIISKDEKVEIKK